MKSLFAVIGDIILFFIFTCILIIPCLVLLNLIPSVNSQTDSKDNISADNISAISVESTSSNSSISSSVSTESKSISSDSSSISSTSSNKSSSSTSSSKSASNSSQTLSISTTSAAKSSQTNSVTVKGASTSAQIVKSSSTAANSASAVAVFTEDVKLSDKIILENKTFTPTEAKFNLKITDIGSGVDQTVQLGKFVNNSSVTKEVSIIFGDYVGIFDKSIVNIKTDTYTYLIQKPAAGLTITLNPKETTYINLILKTNSAMRNEKLLIDMVF